MVIPPPIQNPTNTNQPEIQPEKVVTINTTAAKMISYFTSTINQDANSTVIKTVPLASDNKNYTLANLEPNTNSKQKVEE